ncbi:MAG: NBR1-Ig-like domain-containing protein [Anaerolineaceae bacterium]|nr:NBR1-Ig-like domain-containing protein [Anaerolineaceae bacterium]
MRNLKVFIGIILIAFLAACSIPGTSPTVSPEDIQKALDAIRTEVAQTMAAEIEKGVTSTTGPELPTLAPTATLMPTEIPLPSSTPLPTATQIVLPTAIPATPTATATDIPKAIITVIGVEKNTAVTVQADIFPANQVFKIRVGPFDTFFKDAVEVGTINSGNGGSFKFTVLLPGQVKDVERITVRLDSAAGVFAYNYFKNETSGTIPAVATPVTSSICEVSVSPALSTVMKPGYDFDAVWTVKNISGKTWELGTTDYKYVRGTELHKYEKFFDLNEVVKSGDSVKIRIDMLAPITVGTYTTNWAVVQGSTIICNLPLTIIVK